MNPDEEHFGSRWVRCKEVVRIVSPFVTLIGERWRSDATDELDYWRVEKVDSVIVLPVHREQLLCAPPVFRPGVQRATLDFPGGRLPQGRSPEDMAPDLLERELGVRADAILRIRSLNRAPWIVNSSFSNQGVWGLVAEIDPKYDVAGGRVGMMAPATPQGVEAMLEAIECLQCRAVLLEWARNPVDLPAKTT